jgi:amino-acid N-acetyltransferase
MMNDVKIRAASPADLPTIRGLLAASALPTEGVEDFFPDNYAVAERDDVIIGVAGVEKYGAHGLIRSVSVADNLRGAGIGAALARERAEWSRAHGVSELYLLTTTAADFFARLGYARVGRDSVPAEIAAAPEFAAICPSTAVVMRLPLL